LTKEFSELPGILVLFNCFILFFVLGQTVAGLVREFLEFFNLEFTLAVFDPEAGLVSLNVVGSTNI